MSTLEFITDRRSPVGDVGIELEVEGRHNGSDYFRSWPHVRNWVAKEDGSLRNGMEYVTRTPVKVDDKLEGRIDGLVSALKGNVTEDSYRTSCHVHVNALPLTPKQLVCGMMSFYLTEEILSDVWGEERKGNSFALRLNDGLHLSNIITALNSKEFFSLKPPRTNAYSLHRYSAMNLNAFPRHGSVEFRGMRGSIDTKEILDWAKTVHHIMHVASKRYKSPIHLFENYMNTSNVVDFLKKITGPYLTERLSFSDEKLDLVNDAAIKLSELAYMHDEDSDSWDKWETDLIKERSKSLSPTTESTSSAESTVTYPGYATIQATIVDDSIFEGSAYTVGTVPGRNRSATEIARDLSYFQSIANSLRPRVRT